MHQLILLQLVPLISVELAVVVVPVAAGVAIVVAAVLSSLVGLLVGDRRAVSVLVGLVGHDLLPAIGQQDVVAADGLVSVTGLHVAKVVAGRVVVHVVLEGVLGGLSAVLVASVGVALGVGVSAARGSVRRLGLLGSRVGGLRGGVRGLRGLVGVSGSRGSIEGRGSVLLARGRGRVLLAGGSVLGAWSLGLAATGGSVVGGRTGLVGGRALEAGRRDSVVGGGRQVVVGRGVLALIGRQVGVRHWGLSSGQQDAGQGGENGKQLLRGNKGGS